MSRQFTPRLAHLTSIFFILTCSASMLAQNPQEGASAAQNARGRRSTQRQAPPTTVASLNRRSTLSLAPIVIYYSRDGAETVTKKPARIEKRTAGIGESITIYYGGSKPSVAEPARSVSGQKSEDVARNIVKSSPPPKVGSSNAVTSSPLTVDSRFPSLAANAAKSDALLASSPTTVAAVSEVDRPTTGLPTKNPADSKAPDPTAVITESASVTESAAKSVPDDNRKSGSSVSESKEEVVPARASGVTTGSAGSEPLVATGSEIAPPPPVANMPTGIKPKTDTAPASVANPATEAKPPTETAPLPETNSSAETKPATEAVLPPVTNNPVDDKSKTETAPPPAAVSVDTRPATESAPASVAASSVDTVALNNTAVQLTQEHRYEEASDLLRRAIQVQPDSFKFHRNLSIIYEQMNKFDDALASAETAVKLAPTDPTARMQLCSVQLQMKDHGKALACYENLRKVTTLDPLAQTFYGVALLGSGRVLDALEVLEKAAAVTPASGVALNALGFAYFKDRRYPEAVSNFKKAVELQPDQPEMRFNLAIAHLANRNREGAISQYKLLKDSNPKVAKQLYEIIFRDHIVSIDELKH